MAAASRIPEVALCVEVVIVGFSGHLYAREVPEPKNTALKARNAAVGRTLRERAQANWVLLRSRTTIVPVALFLLQTAR